MLQEKLPGKIVTATAFVRNFGAYARNAGSEPIHILNHGRPAWTLISTDHLDRLTKGGGAGGDRDRTALSTILDTVSTHVLITDGDLRVIRMNLAARQALAVGDGPVQGVPLSSFLPDHHQQFLLRTVERVNLTGMTEALEIDVPGRPPRTFRVKVERYADGVAVFSDETTAQTLVRDRFAIANAYEELMDALPGLARGSVNARGIMSEPSPALAELVQTEPEKLVGMRLPSLFHTSVRTDVADALERMLTLRAPFTMPAMLQTGGVDTTVVTLSAAPHPGHDNKEGAIFLLQKMI